MTNDQAGFEGKPIGRIEKGENQVNKGMNLEKIEALVLFTVMALMVFLTGPAKVNADCVGATTTFYFGDTVTESCTFDGDMLRSDTGTAGHGLIIGTPGITIDGNGFCLDGEVKACVGGETNDAGIYMNKTPDDDLNNVTIKNLEVKNFCHGIWMQKSGPGGLPDTTGNTIECCEVHDNGDNDVPGSQTQAIKWNNVSESVITNCKVYNQEGDPTASGPPGAFGIYLCGGDDNEWCYNEVYDTNKAGLFLRCSPWRAWLHHNYLHHNPFAGIRCQCINDRAFTVEYNYCYKNRGAGSGPWSGGYGIFFGGANADPNCVRYNVCKENFVGISFERESWCGHVYENTACQNRDWDIYVQDWATVTGNCNTCDTAYNYTDTNATSGCLYACGEEPDANFYAVQRFPNNGSLTVKFTNLSTPGSDPEATLDSYFWDFGDGSNSTSQNPYHSYSESGNYTVCLSVTDNKECETGCPCSNPPNPGDPGVTEGRRDTMCQKVVVVEETAEHYILNYSAYPFETREQDNYSGAAVMRMLIDHYRNLPWVSTQEYLQNTGIAHNQSCNSGIGYVDPQGMRWTLNDELHDSTHGKYANYGIGSFGDINDALHYICYWQYAGPGAAPTAPAGQDYSDYSQWMSVRGIHTSEDPYYNSTYDIYGFWINDPKPEGIGENSFKTDTEWISTYYKALGNLEPGDVYEGKYVAVCEPPNQPAAEVNLTPSPARLAEPVNPVTMEEPLELEGLNKMAQGRLAIIDSVLIKKLDEEDSLKMVKAAIDGVTDELIPYDPRFAKTFDKTVPGEPLLVKDDSKDYYLVPFILPIKEKSKEKYEIQSVDMLAGEMVPIPVDPSHPGEREEYPGSGAG
jgi:hypothetical protein